MNRRPCKFGDSCNKFVQGTDCGFLHSQGTGAPSPAATHMQGFNTGGGFNPNMSGVGGMGSRPCKFGPTCRDFVQGKCKFSHDGGSGGMGGMGGQGGQGFPQPSNPQPTGMINQLCKFADQCNNFKMGKCRYLHNNSMPVEAVGSQTRPPVPTTGVQAGIEEVLCKNFHHDRCQNQHCKRLHRFSLDDSVKRLIHTEELPNVFNSNLTWLSKGGVNYIPLKLGNRILFFTYNPENNQIQELNFNHEVENEIIFFKC